MTTIVVVYGTDGSDPGAMLNDNVVIMCDSFLWYVTPTGCANAPSKINLNRWNGGDLPVMSSAPPPPVTPCRIIDPLSGALELTVKLGFELKAGHLKFGGSIYKNNNTGETGGEAGFDLLGIVKVQVDNPTPPGGSLGGTTGGPDVKVSLAGYEKNVSTGEGGFKPSKSLPSLGAALGVGAEISFNPDTFNKLAQANDVCRAQGGK